MQPLSFTSTAMGPLLLAQVRSFITAAEALDDLALLDPSRCRGWSRLDLAVHVRAGLDELAAGAALRTQDPVTHDAASYWGDHPDDRDSDPVPHILWLRRSASAYSRPRAAVRHLRVAAERACAALAAAGDGAVAFQGKVLSVGDFLATWVVELAVHELDLGLDGTPPGCAVARATVEALGGAILSPELDDRAAVLIGLGREPWPSTRTTVSGFPVSL